MRKIHYGLISLVLLNLFPASLLFSCVSLWALDSGMSLAKLGLISLTFSPNSFKFVWAPISDYLKGRFKCDYLTITLTGSALTIACMAYLSTFDPKANYNQFIVLLFFMNFLKSFIWDAIDGYRSQVFSQSEQKLATSVFMTTYRGGLMSITGVAIMAAKLLGWGTMIQLEVAIMIVLLIITCKLLPKSPEFVRQKQFSIMSAFHGLTKTMPLSLGIVMILTYRFGDMWIMSYLSIFLKESARLSTTSAGMLVQVMTPLSILGIWIARSFSKKYDNYKLMYMTTGAHFVGLLLLASTITIGNFYWLAFTILIEETISGFFFFTASMWMIDNRNTEYPSYSMAAFSSLINIPTIFVGPLTSFLVKSQGWYGFFVVPMTTTLASLMILHFYNRYQTSIQHGVTSPTQRSSVLVAK